MVFIKLTRKRNKAKKNSGICDLLNFFINTESMAAYSSPFTGLCLASRSKCVTLFAIIWAGTVQCPGFSPVGVSSTLMFCWWWGPRWAPRREEPLPWGPGVAGGWVTLQAVLGCMQAHRLDMSALPCTLSWLLVLLVCWFFICISFSCGGFSNHLRYTVSFGNF